MRHFLDGFNKEAGLARSLGQGAAIGSAAIKRVGQSAKESVEHAGRRANLALINTQNAISEAPGKMKKEFMEGARSGKGFSMIGETKSHSPSREALKEQFKRHTAQRHADVVKKLNPHANDRLLLPAPAKRDSLKEKIMGHFGRNKGRYSAGAAGGIGAAYLSKKKEQRSE